MNKLKESDIMHENGNYWVAKLKDTYCVFKIGITHSVLDSCYSKDASGLSIAIARCNYLAKMGVLK